MGCVQTRKGITIQGIPHSNQDNIVKTLHFKKQDSKTENFKNSVIKYFGEAEEGEVVNASSINFIDKSRILPSSESLRSNTNILSFNKGQFMIEPQNQVNLNTDHKAISNVKSFKKLDTKKLTLDFNKVQGFERMLHTGSKKNTGKHTKAEVYATVAFSNFKPNFTITDQIQEKDDENREIDSPEKLLLKDEPIFDANDIKEKIHSSDTDEGFLKENQGIVGISSMLSSGDNINNTPCDKISMIAGLNISSIKDDKDKLEKSNLTSLKRYINSIDTSKINHTSKMMEFTGDKTIDYSSLDDDRSPTSQTILKKYNLNPYHNFHVVKKYFIYQLKKSFLQAKKFVLNSAIHGQMIYNQNKNPNYHEIFSNYSQISTSAVNSYIKYEDHNVKVNNYFIRKDKILGKGGFSTVYMCKNLSTGQEHAVKVTDKTVRANAVKKKYDYVKDEVNILKRLYSKYIVKTYEVMETKNECLIFMEFMRKNSLFSTVGRLEEFKIWKYFRNLICGIEHCHEIGKIVHRDININNLLISDDDILKISDFGVSMIIEDNDLIPVNSGPTTYTPPEKKFNDYPFYNGKPADIWCCGVALYHMVYKRPLFKNFVNMDRNDYHVILPDDPEEIIDQNLKDLMMNLLDVNPKNRSTFNDIKKHPWITKHGEFPLPDIHEEALEYVYSLTTEEIRGINEIPGATGEEN